MGQTAPAFFASWAIAMTAMMLPSELWCVGCCAGLTLSLLAL
jgi:hypothetical protein